ncbi:MAG: histidine phosphatase family protein [Chloroflexi bacterium]|nr:histidine phosphatase family protein [Chloroflexota bacterium]
MSNQQVVVAWDAGRTWYLVRHGETEWNRTRRIQGQSDVPLNVHGQSQASLLGRRLRDTAFSAVYASDLSRAMTTARFAVGESSPEIAPVPELREIAYGEWEGLTFAEVEARDPEGFAERMLRQNDRYTPPGGENVHQFVERVRRFHDRARERHVSGERVLVVGHSGSILALLICLLDMPNEFLLRFRMNPAGLSIVRTFDDAAVLELWNDTSHLASVGALDEKE